MKNFVTCLVGFFAMFLEKNQMLKWASEGGGGRMQWRVNNGEQKTLAFPILFRKILTTHSFFTVRLYVG
ncbi:MAG: hypothetical protein LBK82_01140 [Planctomycetaceae bacterium]|jgi:hypothetical protein|nr:hypothetical protein [Planctomycetaceae bacterium]